MRFVVSSAFVIMLAAVLLSACNSNDSQGASKSGLNSPAGLSTQTPSDGAPRITVAELKDLVAKGTVVIVDTRGPEIYEQEHIKGAINIPEGSMTSRAGELPRDKMIVAYCS